MYTENMLLAVSVKHIDIRQAV